MTHAVLTPATAAAKRIEAANGSLVSVALSRRGSVRNPTTGNRAFLPYVDVDVRIDGEDLLYRDSRGSTVTGNHRVTLYGEAAVSAGDRFQWGGKTHTVLAVRGLLNGVTGARYISRQVTD